MTKPFQKTGQQLKEKNAPSGTNYTYFLYGKAEKKKYGRTAPPECIPNRNTVAEMYASAKLLILQKKKKKKKKMEVYIYT